MKTIGIVAEGPRDYEMFCAVIRRFTGEKFNFQQLQPEPNVVSEYGCGWNGVWKWCEQNAENLPEYMLAITPQIDLLIIHLDGDVSRCEKQIHCSCQQGACEMQTETHPLYCKKAKEHNCPIELPCNSHGTDPNDYSEHLHSFLYEKLGKHDDLPVCYVVPCDSTDTWIVAAFDEYESYENLKNPWESIITRGPTYHAIRMKGRPGKKKQPYSELIKKVCEKWDIVVDRCPQAKRFQEDITRLLA